MYVVHVVQVVSNAPDVLGMSVVCGSWWSV